MKIGIIDYCAGNLNSVVKAFLCLGGEADLIRSADEFENFERLVLPGVGSFGYAMREIGARKLIEPCRAWIEKGKPFLGICLGLQLLFESSTESPGVEGLGVMNGRCLKFNARRVPQIGWNSVQIRREDPLMDGLESGDCFYFVHSFYADAGDPGSVVAETEYSCVFPSIVSDGKTYGVQFHPEKSGEKGLKLLQNWMEKC